MKVMVLAGGPDREREISLMSGGAVAAALERAGHEVLQRDIGPDDLSALDEYSDWGGQVVFPVLHGPWGEGGPLQELLERRGIKFVGCRSVAAARCMDKAGTKRVLEDHGIDTPGSVVVGVGEQSKIELPVVVKPLREGSSIDLAICHDAGQVRDTLTRLWPRYDAVLVERYVSGKELTIGVLGGEGHERALPVIRVVPAVAFYDFEAKYRRDDTRYEFDFSRMGLDEQVVKGAQAVAVRAHRALGCRHLSRVDLIVDAGSRAWVLEVNTMPGFTEHSLVPKAAARSGLAMEELVDALVLMAVGEVSE